MPKPPIKPSFKPRPFGPEDELPSDIKGASYAGKLPIPTKEELEKEIDTTEQALDKLADIIKERVRQGSELPYHTVENITKLTYRRIRALSQLRQLLLPPTERSPYSSVLTDYIEKLQLLVQQLEKAEDEGLSELVNLLNLKSKELAFMIQRLETQAQPLGTPELKKVVKEHTLPRLSNRQMTMQLYQQWNQYKQS